MNNINITHELCAEDRARIDRLTAALEALNAPLVNIEAAPIEQDDVQKKLAETLANTSDPAEAPKNATESTEAPAAPIAQEEEETPTATEDAQQEEPQKPTVTLAQIQQKVIELCTAQSGAKKAEVRAAVNAYAKKVSDLPEDKWTEIWEKLVAIEKKLATAGTEV